MPPRRDNRARLAEFEQRCQQLGMPRTIQRRAIFEILLSRQDHPTADEIHADLAASVDGISRTTVYRTLETLVERGILLRVCHHGAAARYDIRTERHHHLVCTACGRMTDFDAPALDRLRLPDFAADGFAVADFSVHVRGLCRTCARPRSPITRSTPTRKP